MKRVVKILTISIFCMLALSACDGESGSPGRGGFQNLSYEEAIARAKEDNLLVMLDFTSPRCGPCHRMDNETFSNRQVKSYLRDNVVAIKVNVDSQRDLAFMYNISSVPAMVFLNGDGNEVARMTGYRPPAQFLDGARRIRRW